MLQTMLKSKSLRRKKKIQRSPKIKKKPPPRRVINPLLPNNQKTLFQDFTMQCHSIFLERTFKSLKGAQPELLFDKFTFKE